MSTFTVWKYDDPHSAGSAVTILKQAQSEGIVKVLDHTVVSWPKDAEKPVTDSEHDEKRRGTGWGAFLGGMVGMLFFAPVLGAVVGGGIGRSVKSSDGAGIRTEDLERIRDSVTPGTSALFLVTEDANLDRLGERFHGMNHTLVMTNLTSEEREMLTESFGGA